ncbi:carboxymuconolactone decarboxylase family protein [Pseudorhodoferax soli]|uniref:Alkylhydroperoxidase family enzyme n=1 Tax=Pseudorhodoferax soli TaxID=545864 RepID=A0A368XPG7_9BURK|nr:carboxymuconolactone decarboxylase family protein [Pseudorhodoferax soli]RCW69439.1 alkylhydroperoxidase family enzyme [Pseudorhodoferax soli]
MPRIPALQVDTLPPALQALLANRPPYNVYRVLAHAPTALPGFMQLASALLTRGELDAQLREMVILRVGAHCRSAYEIHQHLRLARHVGTSNARIDKALRLDGQAATDTLEDRLLAFTDQVVLQVKADAALFVALQSELSPRALVELLLTIGTYMMVSRVLENLEVEVERDDVEIAGHYQAPTSLG